MVYTCTHDQTVADDYFAAMQRVEQRLEIVPVEENMGDVKVQNVFQLIERLELPELCIEERLGIAEQLREVLGMIHEHAPPNHILKNICVNPLLNHQIGLYSEYA